MAEELWAEIAEAAGLHDYRWTPERHLLWHMVFFAVGEARGQIRDRSALGPKEVEEVRRNAQLWFVTRSEEFPGWGFVVEVLRISAAMVKRLEDEAFSNGNVIYQETKPRPKAGRPRKHWPVRPTPRGPLSDDEWRDIEPLLKRKGSKGPTSRYQVRTIVNEILARTYRKAGFTHKPNYRIKSVLLAYYRRKWEKHGAWPLVERHLGLDENRLG